MTTRNYFLETPADEWAVKAAFEELERVNPSSEARVNLRTLKEQISAAMGSPDEAKVSAARKLLQGWKAINRKLFPKEHKSRAKQPTTSFKKNVVNIANNNITINQVPGSSIAVVNTVPPPPQSPQPQL